MRRHGLVLVVILAGLLLVPSVAAAQKLVFVVRHAERADEPARNENDPALSQAGQARARKLETLLADAHVDAIYVTQYRRTRQTAEPLATAMKVKPEVMPTAVPAFVDALKHHANDVVLIVGHSNTIPAIVKALTGSSVSIGESDYGSLFVVVPATHTVVRMRY